MDATTPTENSVPKKQNFPPILITGALMIAVLAVILIRFQMKKGATSPAASTEVIASPVDQTSMVVSPEPTASPSASSSSDMTGAVAGASTSTQTPDQMNVKTLNVEAGSYYFKPNSFTVKKGDTVKIVLTNHDGFHDFMLDEF